MRTNVCAERCWAVPCHLPTLTCALQPKFAHSLVHTQLARTTCSCVLYHAQPKKVSSPVLRGRHHPELPGCSWGAASHRLPARWPEHRPAVSRGGRRGRAPAARSSPSPAASPAAAVGRNGALQPSPDGDGSCSLHDPRVCTPGRRVTAPNCRHGCWRTSSAGDGPKTPEKALVGVSSWVTAGTRGSSAGFVLQRVLAGRTGRGPAMCVKMPVLGGRSGHVLAAILFPASASRGRDLPRALPPIAGARSPSLYKSPQNSGWVCSSSPRVKAACFP